MGEEKGFAWRADRPDAEGWWLARDDMGDVVCVEFYGHTDYGLLMSMPAGYDAMEVEAWAPVATPEEVCALVARAEDDDERLLDAVLASRCGCDSAGCSCGAVMAPCHHCTEHWNDQDGVDSAVHYLDVFSRQIDRVTDDWIKTSNILTAERRAHEKAKAEVKRLQKELDLAHEAAANLCPVWPDPMEELRAIDQEAR